MSFYVEYDDVNISYVILFLSVFISSNCKQKEKEKLLKVKNL